MEGGGGATKRSCEPRTGDDRGVATVSMERSLRRGCLLGIAGLGGVFARTGNEICKEGLTEKL